MRRFFLENDRLWAPPVKTATPLSPKVLSKVLKIRKYDTFESTFESTKVLSYEDKILSKVFLSILSYVGVLYCKSCTVHVVTYSSPTCMPSLS